MCEKGTRSTAQTRARSVQAHACSCMCGRMRIRACTRLPCTCTFLVGGVGSCMHGENMSELNGVRSGDMKTHAGGGGDSCRRMCGAAKYRPVGAQCPSVWWHICLRVGAHVCVVRLWVPGFGVACAACLCKVLWNSRGARILLAPLLVTCLCTGTSVG